MQIKTFIGTLICTILIFLLPGCQKGLARTKQHAQSDTSISQVWLAINESFGGKNFDYEKWSEMKQKFISRDYRTHDEEAVAIESLLETLEEPSVRLLSKEEKGAFLSEVSGQLPAGIGFIELLSIDIDERSNILTVITCLPQTAAAKAGLQTGDKIIKINGVPTERLSLAQAMSKLREVPGYDLSLDILRGNAHLTIVVTSEPASEIPSSVRIFTQQYDGKTIGYIQYLIAAEGSAVDFRRGLSSLMDQGVDAVVLDLRNNPGGSFSDSLAVADFFLEKGEPIVTLIANQDEVVREYYAMDQAMWSGPSAILQNGGSASAAELIAGALHANKKAIIVGQKSYGKGLLHTLVPLVNGGAVMFHIGRLMSPDNRDILHEMIVPDYIIPQIPSPIMSYEQRMVGTEADIQFQYALVQLFKHESQVSK